MLRIVNQFVDGNGWYDLIVRFVLDDLILAVGLFAIALLIWAVFAPPGLPRMLASAQHKLTWGVAVFWLLIGAAVLFIPVSFFLSLLGVIE